MREARLVGPETILTPQARHLEGRIDAIEVNEPRN
jgi:hypothetical protein